MAAASERSSCGRNARVGRITQKNFRSSSSRQASSVGVGEGRDAALAGVVDQDVRAAERAATAPAKRSTESASSTSHACASRRSPARSPRASVETARIEPRQRRGRRSPPAHPPAAGCAPSRGRCRTSRRSRPRRGPRARRRTSPAMIARRTCYAADCMGDGASAAFSSASSWLSAFFSMRRRSRASPVSCW